MIADKSLFLFKLSLQIFSYTLNHRIFIISLNVTLFSPLIRHYFSIYKLVINKEEYFIKIKCIFGKFLSDDTRLYISLHNCVHLESQIHCNGHNTLGAFPGVSLLVKLLLAIKQN